MDNIFKSIDKFLVNFVSKNQYVEATLWVFLILYGALAAPKLPPFIALLFTNPLFKLLVMIAIPLLWNYSPQVAILTAIGFLISMQTLYRYQLFNVVQDIGQTLTKGLRKGTTATGEFIEDVGEGVGSIVSPLVGSTFTGVKTALIDPITGALAPRAAGSEVEGEEGESEEGEARAAACVGCAGPQPSSSQPVLPPQPAVPTQVASAMTGCDFSGPQGLDYPMGYSGEVFGAEYGNCNSEL